MKKSTTLFQLESKYQPAGDQPAAIEALTTQLMAGERDNVLLGVTGSGKTFTMAHTIAKLDRPALIMAPNKTLAAQLYTEMKQFFPHNAVEYFVSYYDYYQPEAYIPRSDTFIEKEATINEQIDRMRHSATRSLLERRDVVIVASVSCIYGIGSVDSYGEMTYEIKVGDRIDRGDLFRELVKLQYKRNDLVLQRGSFRGRGDVVEIVPAHLEDQAWRINMFDDEVEEIVAFDPLTGEVQNEMDSIKLYANSHHITPMPSLQKAMKTIKAELVDRLHELEQQRRLVEYQRLEQRVKFDLEMIESTGFCSGIENYSRHLTGREPGQPPPTLFEYLPKDALLFMDESHVAIPQIGGMYKGDRARKVTLSEHGFRLPSCKDNRPLKFEEWNALRPQTVYVSATPNDWELEQTGGAFIEQIVRPTGLVDPEVIIRPTEHQVDDLMYECRKVTANGGRVLVTTLTKKMAEHLAEYLNEHGLRVRYLHSDIDTLERIEIMRDLRLGEFDILIGINLLREGLDIPECQLVAILDADKEGFLRSRTSLIQTIGRAARNLNGRAILYADTMTKSLTAAIEETARRRQKQLDHNKQHGITPKGIEKAVNNILKELGGEDAQTRASKAGQSRKTRQAMADNAHLIRDPKAAQSLIKELSDKMHAAASDLDFETAAELRDQIKAIETQQVLGK